MPPKKTAKLSNKSADAPPKTRSAVTTFNDILAQVPSAPPPMHIGPKGFASNLDENLLEDEVLIHEIAANEPGMASPQNESDDWETDDEVEDQLVVVEVNGFIDPVILHSKINDDLVKLRHPESETPILQIGGQLFAGKYKEADGSVLIIEEKNETETPSYSLEGITDVVLDARKTYLFAKGASESQPGEELRKPIELRATQKANKALSMNIRKKNQ